jgi:hypothetical protein
MLACKVVRVDGGCTCRRREQGKSSSCFKAHARHRHHYHVHVTCGFIHADTNTRAYLTHTEAFVPVVCDTLRGTVIFSTCSGSQLSGCFLRVTCYVCACA